MGFYLKKSVSFGGVRFNFSKSGIGASVGVKGFRVGTGPRGNYIHMGRNGIYYRAALGRKKSRSQSVQIAPPEGVKRSDDGLLFQEIESGDISFIVDSSSQEIVDEINHKRKKILFCPFAILFLLVPTGGIFLAGTAALLIYSLIDRKRKTTVIFYDIDEQSEQEIQQFYSAFDQLMNCHFAWHITAQADVRDRKYHAGASLIVKRTKIQIQYKTPPYMKTNVKVPSIPTGKQILYFFPDRILVYEKKKVGGLSYANLSITQRGQRFIEDGPVPKDGTIIDHTWRYVNKSGGPDKRFKDNRQLPVLMYSDLSFKSNTGMNELIELSRQDIGSELIRQLDKYQTNTLWGKNSDIPKSVKAPSLQKQLDPTSSQKVKNPEAYSFKVTSQVISSQPEDVIPVEKRIKDAIPSSQGLYPHEILALDYAHSYYMEGNHYQRFWWYEYGVKNVDFLLSSLMERGFLQVGGLKSAIENETGTVLKEELKKHGLKVSGKKIELVNRLLSEITEDELNSRFTKRTYQLTELGKNALEEEAYVPYIHRHPLEGLDIWSLNRLVHNQPFMPFRDKIWGYLNQRSMEHISARNYGLYRNCRYNMSVFLQEEKRYREALTMLSEVIFYDLSGLDNNFNLEYLNIYAKSYFPYKDSIATTAPGILKAILKCQEELGISEDELKAELLDTMKELNVPFHLFTPEECVEIVFLEINEDAEELTKVYEKSKRRFKQKYPHISC